MNGPVLLLMFLWMLQVGQKWGVRSEWRLLTGCSSGLADLRATVCFSKCGECLFLKAD